MSGDHDDLDAGVPAPTIIDAEPIEDAGIYVYPPAGTDPPIWVSEAELRAADRIISAVINLVPGIGTAKGLYEAFSGKDFLTGEEKAWWERTLDATAAFGSALRTASKLGNASNDSRKLIYASDDVVDALNDMPHLKDLGHAGYRTATTKEAFIHASLPLAKFAEMVDKGAEATSLLEAIFDFVDENYPTDDQTAADTDIDGGVDLDGDGIPDMSPAADEPEAEGVDVDGDGIPDMSPAADEPEAEGVDVDGDGIPDLSPAADEPEAEGVNVDGDGTPDMSPAADEPEAEGVDLDGDGTPDLSPAGDEPSDEGVDVDGDGTPDLSPADDAPGDGSADGHADGSNDVDVDGDGTPDMSPAEDEPHDDGSDGSQDVDVDGDGTPDMSPAEDEPDDNSTDGNQDVDVDGDGIPDMSPAEDEPTSHKPGDGGTSESSDAGLDHVDSESPPPDAAP